MIVLDASVLIAHLDGADQHHSKAMGMLEAHSGERLGASAITLAETLVSPARAGRLADAEAILRRLGVEQLSLGENAPGQLAQLRVETGLKMPDCCVILTAQEHGGVVASFDQGMLAATRKLGLGTLSISRQRCERGLPRTQELQQLQRD